MNFGVCKIQSAGINPVKPIADVVIKGRAKLATRLMMMLVRVQKKVLPEFVLRKQQLHTGTTEPGYHKMHVKATQTSGLSGAGRSSPASQRGG